MEHAAAIPLPRSLPLTDYICALTCAWCALLLDTVCGLEMRVCDLFAGLGGFTCGALEAGADVVLAVDSDPVPLKLLGANAPRTKTVVATLGRDSVELPPAAPDLHVHMSTPCTTLSMARRGKAASDTGLQMIRWAVEFVLERGDHSWSLENVATRATRALFSELEAAYPHRHGCSRVFAVKAFAGRPSCPRSMEHQGRAGPYQNVASTTCRHAHQIGG